MDFHIMNEREKTELPKYLKVPKITKNQQHTRIYILFYIFWTLYVLFIATTWINKIGLFYYTFNKSITVIPNPNIISLFKAQ